MANRLTFKIRSWLSGLLDRAENPAETLDYHYQLQVEQLYRLRREIADLATAKQRVIQQRDRRREQFRKLDAGARTALTLGHEALAREALERKRVVGGDLIGLDQQIAELKRQQAQLTEHGRRFRAKVERLRTDKEVVKAQYGAAQARVAFGEAMTGASSQLRELGDATRRATDHAEDLQLRASVAEELEATGVLTPIGSGENDIDRQLRLLASGGSIDDELARMKRQLPGGPPPGP